MTTQSRAGPSKESWQEPEIHCRHAPERALCVRVRVLPAQLGATVSAALESLSAQLQAQGVAPNGQPFIAYHSVASDGMEVEIGVPVSEQVQAGAGLHIGALPAGRYVGFRHHGTSPALGDMEQALQGWISRHGERSGGPLYVTLDHDHTEGDADGTPCVIVARGIMAGSSGTQPAAPLAHGVNTALEIATAATARLMSGWSRLRENSSSEPIRPRTSQERATQPEARIYVADVMSQDVRACTPMQSLNEAARLLWNHDLGALPVVDDKGRPLGMITDRDICMAAYTQGRLLREIPVASAMSRHPFTCRPHDLLQTAEQTMASGKVRRLPVVDAQGVLVGLLSLNDVVLARACLPFTSATERLAGGVIQTVAAISQHRRSLPGGVLSH